MNVLPEFINAINIESEKQIEESRKLMELTLADLITKGVAMADLRVEFEFFDPPNRPSSFCPPLVSPMAYIKYAKIYCERNLSKFKEGSPVLLSNGTYTFEMEVEEDSINNFILKYPDFNSQNCKISKNEYPRNNWIINESKSDITIRMLRTTATVLEEDGSKLEKVETLLNGLSNNSQENYSERLEGLNNSQNDAYLKAINSSKFCLIQGPPGTGKTETIAYITKKLIEQGKKVFITAPTSTAINNCLKAISSKVCDKRKVVKIGTKPQNKELRNYQHIFCVPKLQYFDYYDNPNFNQNGIAVGATSYSLCYPSSNKLKDWEFDVCIVDEASQLSIPLSIAAMFRTNKHIFVGDHKQLDPIIPRGTDSEMFDESIFSRLARLYPNEINLLNISYRLNESLIGIPNKLFYDNKLSSSITTSEDIAPYLCNHYPDILNNSSHILVIHNVFDGNGRSKYEAEIVAKIVSDLLNNDVELSQIGIMSPYRAQVREIKNEVNKIIPATVNNPFDTLFVDTVDSMQGQERDYIIYSFANSHPLQSSHRLDFFYNPNRLNVAITRAKKKCIVVSNYKVFSINEAELQNQTDNIEIINSLKIFKRYYDLSQRETLNEEENNEY